MPIDLIDELRWRGLIHQCTDEAGLRAHLASGTRSIYAGFDPTADSVTIGNLVPIMMLVHVQRAGHEPVVVMGGGTGLIGDPSGKSAERQLMTEETVRRNVEAIRPIFERVFANAAAAEGRNGATHGGAARTPPILNNLDWLGKLGYLEALRDIGKHFSVNMMIQKDSVRARLHERDQGISYTEFSYMILQSYDYLVLFRDFAKHGLPRPVTLQMGGSDQWGNIVSGGDLIHGEYWLRVADSVRARGVEKELPGGRMYQPGRSEIERPDTFGLTAPLVTKADGGKFGKTESGAIWLTAPAGPSDTSKARTSAYAYYQFWLNASDADAGRYLRIFTLLPKERIEAIEAEHAKDPSQRLAQRELARAATALLHGTQAVEHAESAAKALFSGDIVSLPEATLREALAEAPSSTHDKALLAGGTSAGGTSADGGAALEGLSAADLVALSSLVKEHSKSEARQLVKEGSISVNGRKIGPQDRFTPRDLLHGSILAVRRGKKAWHLLKWE
ncbi:MAG: tyrosine--tRNA ligase [Phycisphaerales bacterium]